MSVLGEVGRASHGDVFACNRRDADRNPSGHLDAVPRTTTIRYGLQAYPVGQGLVRGLLGGAPQHRRASAVSGGCADGGHRGDGEEALNEEHGDQDQNRHESNELNIEDASLVMT